VGGGWLEGVLLCRGVKKKKREEAKDFNDLTTEGGRGGVQRKKPVKAERKKAKTQETFVPEPSLMVREE